MKKMSSDKKVLVMGATGYFGSALFAQLQKAGARVTGTSRIAGNGLLALETTDENQVTAFPWQDFDIVVDCTGVISYDHTEESVAMNTQTNVVAPLSVVSKLTAGQQYFYCSTHAVLAPEAIQNPYSRSKKMFEERERVLAPEAMVTVLRLPALFDESRHSGLLYKIKTAAKEKKPLELTISNHVWHAMFLPRVATVVATVIFETTEPLVTIGYPTETTITEVLRVAKDIFGDDIPVTLTANESDGYVPLVSEGVATAASDFTHDLETYFKA